MRTSDPVFVHFIRQSRIGTYRTLPLPHFTERELAIIRLICQQLCNKEIAHELGLSPRTIESYRERIFEKTGARNMVGVAIYAIKHDLYTP